MPKSLSRSSPSDRTHAERSNDDVDYHGGSGAAQPHRSGRLLGNTMGLVALTWGLFALGAYIGRDTSGGWAILWFIAALAVLLAMNAAARRSVQLAIGLLFGLGALLGLAVAPAVSSYAFSPRSFSCMRDCYRICYRPRVTSAHFISTGVGGGVGDPSRSGFDEDFPPRGLHDHRLRLDQSWPKRPGTRPHSHAGPTALEAARYRRQRSARPLVPTTLWSSRARRRRSVHARPRDRPAGWTETGRPPAL